MKFVFTNTDGWRWNLTAANGKIICSGESYQRPQKMVNAINNYIVRGDEYLTEVLEYSLYQVGLDAQGRKLKGE